MSYANTAKKGGKTSNVTTKKSLTPWLMTLAFVLPVAMAYLVLKQGWYQGGATNHGQLLQGLSYDQLRQKNPAPGKWQLVTSFPEDCSGLCQHRMELIRQIQVALGRERPRVKPVMLVLSEKVDANQGSTSFLTIKSDAAASAAIAPYSLVIVDPLGQWVMGYPKLDTEESQQSQSRDLLLDFRKLLKLSRIG